MPSREDLLELAKTIRYDLTAAQAKLTELMTLVAQLPVTEPGRYACPDCGLEIKPPRSLSEHRYFQHDGPEPDTWIKAEAQADLEPKAEPETVDELAHRRKSR